MVIEQQIHELESWWWWIQLGWHFKKLKHLHSQRDLLQSIRELSVPAKNQLFTIISEIKELDAKIRNFKCQLSQEGSPGDDSLGDHISRLVRHARRLNLKATNLEKAQETSYQITMQLLLD